MSKQRPSIKVRFQFNLETGEMDLVIDDNAPHLSEAYHDKIATALASYLGRNPDIQDAGSRYALGEGRLLGRAREEEREREEAMVE